MRFLRNNFSLFVPTCLIALLFVLTPSNHITSASAQTSDVEETGSITGLVEGPAGSSVPAGTYAVLSSFIYDDFGHFKPEKVAEADVDPSTGQFDFAAVPFGEYVVDIFPPHGSGYAPILGYWLYLWDAEFPYELGTLTLEEVSLFGQVFAPDQTTPVDGWVDLYDETSGLWYGAETIEGRFFFGSYLEPGTYKVEFHPHPHEGFGPITPFEVTVVAGVPKEVNIVMEAPTLHGVAVDDQGNPIPFVDIFLSSSNDQNDPSGGYWNSAFTGDNGKWAFSGVPDGTYLLEAYAWSENNLVAPEPFEITLPTNQNRIEIVFEPFSDGLKSISGTILDSSGQPITDAWVSAHHMERYLFTQTETDENGEYTLDLSPGEWSIFIEQKMNYDDFGCDPMMEPDCEPACDPMIDPMCEPGCDPMMEPDCEPHCDPMMEPDCEPYCDPMMEPDCEPHCDPMMEPDCEPHCDPMVDPMCEPECDPMVDPMCEPPCDPMIDPMCDFRGFDMLKESIQQHWHYNQPPEFVYFDDDGLEENVIIDFDVQVADSAITGKILMPDDSVPPFEVGVDAFNSEGFGTFGQINWETGEFTLPVISGGYEIFIHPFTDEAEGPDMINTFVEPGSTTDLGIIYLATSSATISGMVTDGTNGIGNVPIHAWKVNGMGWRDKQTSPSGEFTLNVSPGTWHIMPAPYHDQGYIYAGFGIEVTIEEGETLENINFELRGSNSKITGQVMGDEGVMTNTYGWVHVESVDSGDTIENRQNEPIPGCEPTADPTCEEPPFCEPDSGTICEEPPHCEPDSGVDCEEPPHCEPDSGVICEEPPHCEPDSSVDCEEPPHCDETIDPECKDPFEWNPPEIVTGAPIINGQYEVNVPAGEYRIFAFVDGGGAFANSEMRVTVGDNETVEADIELLSPDATIEARLVNAATGDVLTGVEGWVYAWSQNNFIDGRVDADTGIVTLEVISGTWQVDHWLEDFEQYVPIFSEENRVSVESEETVTLDLKVAVNSATVSGTVVDPDDNPLPRAAVLLIGQGELDGVWIWRDTDENGQFNIQAPAGEYKLEAAYGGNHGAGTHWFWPEPIDVTLSDETPVTDQTLKFRTADAELSGEITIEGATFNPDENPFAFIWGWSDTGGFNEVEIELFTDGTNISGTYSMPVIDGTWYMGAVYEDGTDVWFGGGDVEVDGDTTADFTLTQGDPLPPADTQTFNENEPFQMELADGTEISIPQGAMPVTGTITLSIEPIAALPDQDHADVINYGYTILARDSDGRTIEEDFDEEVTIKFPYDENDLNGIPEAELVPAYFSTTTGQWTVPDNYAVDVDNNIITMRINHFTNFAVVGDPAEATQSSNGLFLPFILSD